MFADKSNDSVECPDGWKYLPTLSLPDGSHNFSEDTVFFNLPSLKDPRKTVYGISCYVRIHNFFLLGNFEAHFIKLFVFCFLFIFFSVRYLLRLVSPFECGVLSFLAAVFPFCLIVLILISHDSFNTSFYLCVFKSISIDRN